MKQAMYHCASCKRTFIAEEPSPTAITQDVLCPGCKQVETQFLQGLDEQFPQRLVIAPTVRVGVAALVRRGSYMLMGLRKGSHGAGTWSFPGGHLEPHETVRLAASRELLEETGIVIPPAGFEKLTFTDDVFVVEQKHYITLYVSATCPEGVEPRLREPETCERWEWVRPWPTPLFLPIQNLLVGGFTFPV